jgi:hypothetical protein
VGCVSSSAVGEERLGRTKKVLVKLSRVLAEGSEGVLQIEGIFRRVQGMGHGNRDGERLDAKVTRNKRRRLMNEEGI